MSTFGYFLVLLSTSGYFKVLLGNFGYSWALFGTLGYFLVLFGQEIAGNGQEMSGNGQELVRKCQEMVRKWSEIIRIMSKIVKHTKKREEYILYTSSLSAEGAKACSKKRKRSTILPISMVQSFFCVLFFSFCSNLSIWPGRQVVPYESRCYTPIFDGLVGSSSWFLSK